MQLVSAVNSNHRLRCSVCGKHVSNKSWWFNIALFLVQGFFFEVSACRTCADTPDCDIIDAIKRRKTWWHKKPRDFLQTGLLMGGFAATLDQQLAGETKNDPTC